MKSLVASAILSLALITSAQAQQTQCGNRAKIVEVLTKKHKEVQTAIGLNKQGQLMEVWANPKSHSFTVMIVWPSMRACIITAGQEFAIDLQYNKGPNF